MVEPTTQLPENTATQTGERDTLRWFVDYFRAVLARKAEGLTDEQARRAACPPSDMTLLGIVRHMADVERQWFNSSLPGVELPPIYYGASHPDGDADGDFHPPPGATIDDALATYWAEIAEADRNMAGFELDDVEKIGHRRASLRWILVHMVEEYARHCGHADLLRQAIDGAVGD